MMNRLVYLHTSVRLRLKQESISKLVVDSIMILVPVRLELIQHPIQH